MKRPILTGLSLVLPWIGGCTPTEAPAKNTQLEGSDTPDPTGTTEPTPTPSNDTGIALLWYQATAQVQDGTFVGGTWGTIMTDLEDLPSFDTLLCDNTGAWSYVSDAPTRCPDCAWAFVLSVSDTQATGASCGDFGRMGGEWDGFEHAWGFSDATTYVYGADSFLLEDVLWYFYDAGGYWFFLSYNYGGYGYNEGDATDMTARRNYAYAYTYPG